jgi:hypothetical protein
LVVIVPLPDQGGVDGEHDDEQEHHQYTGDGEVLEQAGKPLFGIISVVIAGTSHHIRSLRC